MLVTRKKLLQVYQTDVQSIKWWWKNDCPEIRLCTFLCSKVILLHAGDAHFKKFKITSAESRPKLGLGKPNLFSRDDDHDVREKYQEYYRFF